MTEYNTGDQEKNGQHEIIDESKDRRYFTLVPNYVDDLELSPHAFRLYVHIKRVTGESGKCWQSTRTLAENCKMGMGSVTRAKKELAESRLIEIDTASNPHGGKDYHIIRIVDIWVENSLKYAASTKGELDGSEEGVPSTTGELTSTKGELKNIPNKKNQYKHGEKKDSEAVVEDENIYTPSASASQTTPPLSSPKEEEFLDLLKLAYSINGDLSKKQKDKILKLYHQYRKNDDLYRLLDCLAYYATDGVEFNDGFLIRFNRALKDWNTQIEKSVADWYGYFSSSKQKKELTQEDLESVVSRLNLTSEEEHEYWQLFKRNPYHWVFEAAKKAIEEQKGLWFVKEQLHDWEENGKVDKGLGLIDLP